MRTRIRAVCAALALAALAGGGLAAEAGAPYALKVITPKANETSPGATAPFYAELTGKPGEKLLVRVECAQIEHFIMVDPADPAAGKTGKYYVWDDMLLTPGGPQKMNIEVQSFDSGKTVLTESVSFQTVGIPAADAQKEVSEARRRIARAAAGVRQAWDWYLYNMESGETGEKVQAAADSYLDARSGDLTSRTEAYAWLADFYDKSLEPAKALASLQRAQSIYESEQKRTLTGKHYSAWPIIYNKTGAPAWAPGHFQGYVRYYAKRGALVKAVELLQKEAQWYADEAKFGAAPAGAKAEARKREARTYHRIALLNVLLGKDLDAYRTWMDKFSRTLGEPKPGATAGLSLLGGADYYLVRGRD